MVTANDAGEHREALLPFYVYVLADPTSEKVFYVGKGQDQRVLQHWKEVNRELEKDLPTESSKNNILRRLKNEGKEPLQLVIGRYKLESEAFCVEATLINWMYGYDNLSNLNRGKGAHLIRQQGVFDKLQNIDVPRPDRGDNSMTLVELDTFFQPRRSLERRVIEFSRFIFDTVENILINRYSEQMTQAELVPALRSAESRITHFLDSLESPVPLEKPRLPKVVFRNRLDGRTSNNRLHIEITKSKTTDFESIFSALNVDDSTRAEVNKWKIREYPRRYELLLPVTANPHLIRSILLVGITHSIGNILNVGN